ncbi:MAG: flavin-containing monooxygenase, partial [Acidimicrobiales bacterium]
MAIQLRRDGFDDVVVLERGDDVGGTWRDNTYPGAACDVPSSLYSFSFAPNPHWSRSFSSQPEILDYLRGCAHRFGVWDQIRFGHDVRSARWDEAAGRWRVTTSKGVLSARFVIAGMGPLAEPSAPDLPGLADFEGAAWHSARWDHAYDLAGRNVAVIGTGASAIQLIPEIQPTVATLYVLQRTPPWVMARRDRAFTGGEHRLFSAAPAAQLAVRAATYWAREGFFLGFRRMPALLKAAEKIALHQLRAQVRDPELRAKVTPSYALGCKRVLLSDEYYPALVRDNVEVVTDPVAGVRPHSLALVGGSERRVDVIIFATGFKATDPPQAAMIWGRGGKSLAGAWKDGMSAYKGTAVAGFPNLFTLVGPNTGLGHNSMVYMIESQVAYVASALRQMRAEGLGVAEVRPAAEGHWRERVQRDMSSTVWMTGGCASWYLDARGRNTTLWPGFSFQFRRATRRFDPGVYRLSPAPAPRPAAPAAPSAPSAPGRPDP